MREMLSASKFIAMHEGMPVSSIGGQQVAIVANSLPLSDFYIALVHLRSCLDLRIK